MEGGPAAAVHGISESGWMDGANFLSWFMKLFLPAVPYLTETAPVLLFLDGHHSHISLELIRRARGNNILLLCLPPNTTHLLQPLDVGVFAPMKSAWRAILKRYKLETKRAVSWQGGLSQLNCKAMGYILHTVQRWFSWGRPRSILMRACLAEVGSISSCSASRP